MNAASVIEIGHLPGQGLGDQQTRDVSTVKKDRATCATCKICPMHDGNHEVRSAWGVLAVRLPLPEDPTWKAAQITLPQALGVLDPQGNPTARLEAVKAADVARLDQASFDKARKKMIKTGRQCRAESFARDELEKGDQIIRQEADHQLAEVIRIVAGLYQHRVLSKPADYACQFSDLLAFHNAPTPIEPKLFVMHVKHLAKD